MIDTIIISVPKDKITNVLDPKESSLGWHQQATGNAYTKFVRNPNKRELETGLYFPRLTGINRRVNGEINASIKIEFSIPKLLFLNNLDEVEEKDFGLIITELKDRLRRMGLLIEDYYLRNASVSAVHYSKNIQLTDGYTAQFVISELNKLDCRKSFDATKTTFMNNGQSMCAYTNAHSFVVYDKISDLKKDSKRAIDKDQTKYQRSLFDEIKKKDLYEVIRFEIRLSKKQKLNNLFKQLWFKESPTFEDAFSKDISQTVVEYYWQTLVANNSALLFGFIEGPKDMLKQILIANPKLKPKQALYFASLISMVNSGNGTRELRSILDKYSDNRTWYRVKEDIVKVSEMLKKVRPRDWFEQIEVGLKQFNTFKRKA